jgi:hypothetical protein
MIGLLLLTIGFGVVNEGQIPAILLIGLGAYMLWRQFDANGLFPPMEAGHRDLPTRREMRAPLDEDEPRATSAEKVYAHALRAVERAGLDPNTMQVLPVDIGVMALRKGEDPVVYRTHPVLDDAEHIQPFVQLRLPKKAVGRIKFEILDADGQVIFVREDNHQLDKGRNLVTPPARLPIHNGSALHRDWQLRISADGMPLATHTFAWRESDERRIRRHMSADGEINNVVRSAIAEERLQDRVSLDDLLSYQDGDADQQQNRR